MAGSNAAYRSREQSAHAAAVKMSTADVLGYLMENLGQNLTAFIADVSTRTLARWVNGETQISGTAESNLRATYQIFQLLLEVEESATVRAWFMGMNPQLDDLSPAEAIVEGRLRETMASARAFLAGG